MPAKQAEALGLAAIFDDLAGADKPTVEQVGPWREDPLPLGAFCRDHMNLELWPTQRECLEPFLGATTADTKALFSQTPPTPYNCGVLALGKGCLGPNEKLTDYLSGLTLTVKEWARLGWPLVVKSWDGEKITYEKTSPVYQKGIDRLYRIILEDGRSFLATANHRCLSPEGWLPVGKIQAGRTQVLAIPLGSNAQTLGSPRYSWEGAVGENLPCEWGDRTAAETLLTPQESCLLSSKVDLAWPLGVCLPMAWVEVCPSCADFLEVHGGSVCGDFQTILGFQSGCLISPRFCGGQPHEGLEIGLGTAPSLNDALERSRCDWRGDDCQEALSLGCTQTCLPFGPRWAGISHEVVHGGASSPPLQPSACVAIPPIRCAGVPSAQTVYGGSFQTDTPELPLEGQNQGLFFCGQIAYCKYPNSFPKFTKVLAVKDCGESEYYDLTVKNTHCYFDANGILHHNSGKDLTSALALAWFTHILYCLDHPQKFLGLEPTEAVDLAIASPTLRQTRRVTFTKLKNRFRRWPWLRGVLKEHYGVDFERHWKTHVQADMIELPLGPDGGVLRVNNLPLDTSAAEGFNLLAFILSEYAGLESESAGESATAVFETFISSGKTRFNRAWKGFLASYPRSVNDPQEKLIEAHEAGKFPELYVVRRPTWEVVPHLSYDDFAGDFIRDPEGSWAKYGAQPRAATEAYFRSPDLIVKNASGGPPDLMGRYLELEGDALALACDRVPDPILERDLFGDVILDPYGFPVLAPWFVGKPEREYLVHIDLGLTGDSAGFAMAHLEPVGDRDDRVIPVLDLSFRWKAAHFAERGRLQRYNWDNPKADPSEVEILQSEIDLQTPVEFCVYLVRRLGFTISRVTFDQFNSATAKQTLYHYGIHSQNLSVDRNPRYYDELKAVIYARQLIYRIDPVLFGELRKLVRLSTGKIDAPRSKLGEGVDSHKDVSDSVASVIGALCMASAASGEFYTLPEPEPFEVVQDAPAGVVEFGGDLSDGQRSLMDEFFS